MIFSTAVLPAPILLPGFPHVSLSDFYNSLTETDKKYVNPTGKKHKFSTDPHRPYIDSVNIDQIGLRSASQFFDTDDKTNGVIEIYPTIEEMAFGGVNLDNIAQVKSLGFGGAVILGDIWNRFSIHSTQDFKGVIQHFRKLRKAAD